MRRHARSTLKKTLCGVCGAVHRTWYDRKPRRVRDLPAGDKRVYLELEVRRVFCRKCRAVKQEKLEFLADNPFYSKRFAFFVGRRCRTATISDVAKETHLDWKTIKEMEKQYMREQLRRVGSPAPEVIGIDEIAVRKGHTYRIVISDLVRRRPIWFGGKDRSEESMFLFYDWLGPERGKRLRLAVMDMWRAFRTSTIKRSPHTAILYDKFHVLRNLGVAMDKVRKSECARLTGKDRRFIKGQKYALLSRSENLSNEGRASLKLLLRANKRINTAYVLKESFSQLWEFTDAAKARRFFENWRNSLKRQRLKPYEHFAKMVDEHWVGVAAYCEPQNRVALGFVEGLNNKIRVLQRRAYGLRDEEYLRLKVLTCTLDAI